MPISPAFQFYPNDFLGDENQMLMTPAEAGAYIRIMCVCWNEGSIPTDLRKLAKLAGGTVREMKKWWPALAPCFDPHPVVADRLVHPRLEKERRKQAAHHEKMSNAGKKGAERRHGRAEADPHPSYGQAIAKPQPGPGSALAFQFSSSSSSSPSGGDSKPPADAALPERQQAGLEDLIAFVGDGRRPSVQTVAAMPGIGAAWAHGLLATWGPRGSMEGDRIPAAMRGEVVGIALERYATDRERWYSPGFRAFVDRAYTDLLEHRAAQAKADEAKATARERDDWKAGEAARIERMNEVAREDARRRGEPPADPNALVRSIVTAKSLGGSTA